MAIDKIDKIKWDQPWEESFKKAKKIRQISDDTNQGCQKEPRREVEHVGSQAHPRQSVSCPSELRTAEERDND